MVALLENEPRSQLYLTGTIRNGIDRTERRARRLQVRRSEGRMIQHIECFDSELGRFGFVNLEVLDYRCIEVVDTVLPVLTERGRNCSQMELILRPRCRHKVCRIERRLINLPVIKRQI